MLPDKRFPQISNLQVDSQPPNYTMTGVPQDVVRLPCLSQC